MLPKASQRNAKAMKTLKSTILIAALSFVLGACSYNPNDYSCFADIPAVGWSDDEVFLFTPEIDDSIASGTLHLLVRNTNNYPYSNLWVELETRLATDSGLSSQLDTLCIELADVYGNWHGTGIGTSYQLKQPIISPYTLRNGSPIRLRHIMRPEVVTGLEQIGIIFTANEQ